MCATGESLRTESSGRSAIAPLMAVTRHTQSSEISPCLDVAPREMEYIERTSFNTFYPFQNKHQIHWHLQSVKMLCAFKNQNLVCHEMD